MTMPAATRGAPTATLPLLEAIRHTEAKVKRRLAAEREAAQTAMAEAERRACQLIAAAEAEGQREGEAQREAARAESEHESAAIVATARAEAEGLRRAGEEQLETAVARAVQIVVGDGCEA